MTKTPSCRSAFAHIALFLVVLGCCALQTAPSSQPSPAAAPVDVPIANPGPKFRLVGRLGKPMGETVILQGLVIPGPTKGYEGGPNIIVQCINGQATQQYLSVPIAPIGAWGDGSDGRKGPPKLTIGGTFEFQGYETGGFVGIPADAYRRAGLALATCDHYFRSVFSVFGGSKTEPIRYSPADFVDRNALLEGTARNRDSLPIVEGNGWEIALDGPAWPSTVVEKAAEAFGTVRKAADGSFRLESGANGHRGLVKLEDQFDREVTLRGTALSMNGDTTFNYRGKSMHVEIGKSQAGEVWPHGDPVSVTGYLQRFSRPQRDEPNDGTTYLLQRATWRRTRALLIPEMDMTHSE